MIESNTSLNCWGGMERKAGKQWALTACRRVKKLVLKTKKFFLFHLLVAELKSSKIFVCRFVWAGVRPSRSPGAEQTTQVQAYQLAIGVDGLRLPGATPAQTIKQTNTLPVLRVLLKVLVDHVQGALKHCVEDLGDLDGDVGLQLVHHCRHH